MGVWRSRAVTRLDVQGGGARLLDAIEVDSSRGHCDARPVHPAGGSRPSRGSSSVPRAEAERTDLLRRPVTTLGQPVDGWQGEAQLQTVLLLSHTLSHRHTRRHAHTLTPPERLVRCSGPSPSHSFPHSSTPLPSQRRQRSQERDLVGDRTQNESRRFFSGSLFLYTHGLSTPMQRATRSLGRGRLCRPHAEPTHGAAQRHRAAHGRRADRHHSWWLARGERHTLFSPLPSAPRP